jgi:hypothetical protein
MADRALHTSKTQGVEHVDLNFQLLPNGASAPTLGEGDAAGAYVTTLTHVATGKWSFTTSNPYVAAVAYTATPSIATPPTTQSNMWITAVKNANNTFTFTIWYYVAGTLTDIAQSLPTNGVGGSSIIVELVMRNSNTLP